MPRNPPKLMENQVRELEVDFSFSCGATALGSVLYDGEKIAARVRDSDTPAGSMVSARIIQDSRTAPDWLKTLASAGVSFTPRPLIHAKGYHSQSDVTSDDMYPPSTRGWIKRMSTAGRRASYFVFEVSGSKKYLLLIFDESDKVILEGHLINQYEIGVLEFERDIETLREINLLLKKKSVIASYTDTEGPSPDMAQFEQLLDQVEPGVFKYVSNSFDETLESLVPPEFPAEVRKQLKQFYAFVVRNTVPDVDPVDLWYGGLSSLMMKLVGPHVACLLDDVKPPPYVAIMKEAASGDIPGVEHPLRGEIEPPSWYKGLMKIVEMGPSWYDRSFKHAQILEQSGTLPRGIPVTRREAAKSREAWKDRLAIAALGLGMRANVHVNRIGLKYLLYFGSAYRWPHRHTAWSARLERKGKTPWYVQVMIMPPRAIEDALRVIPTAMPIKWQGFRTNFSQFNTTKNQWMFSVDKTCNALTKSKTDSALRKSLKLWREGKIEPVTAQEAQVMSRASTSFYLAGLDAGVYSQVLKMDTDFMMETLESLEKRRVLAMKYIATFYGLVPIAVVMRGERGVINSFVSTIVTQAPSASVFISDNGEQCLLILRLPRRAASELVAKLPKYSNEADINVDMYSIDAYSAYMNDIYSRLLLEDGSWDSDISGLESQSRVSGVGRR
ncbi:MAG: hypothetical protein ACP6KW_12220 [Candidatus Thorarchaeota archaeon]